jgi:flagellar motor switch protein FliM
MSGSNWKSSIEANVGDPIASDRLMSESLVEDGIANRPQAAAATPIPAPEAKDAAIPAVTLFDARRPDRIAKSHLRAVQLLYENFVRSVMSSLSAYLRNYISLNLVAVEQLSCREFLDRVPSCSSMACVGVQPYGGNAIFEINPSLTFPMLEILLGGGGKPSEAVQRELTEIEQMLMDGLFRIIAHDLSEAWKQIARVDFEIVSVGPEGQLLQTISPTEAVLAAKIEMRLGESSGSMNIAMPSLAVNMMSQKFDHERSIRKSDTPPEEQARVFDLIQNARIKLEARLPNQQIRVEDLLALETGDVLVLDLPIDAPVQLLLNGQVHFVGSIAGVARKRAIQLSSATVL